LFALFSLASAALRSNEEAIVTTRKLALREGIPAGISSGAALACAMRVAKGKEMMGHTVVTVLPDAAKRYLSTVLFEGYADA
jgi:cysteine synthase A